MAWLNLSVASVRPLAFQSPRARKQRRLWVLGIALAALLALTGATTWAWSAQVPQRLAVELHHAWWRFHQQLGLTITDIQVSGRREVSQAELIGALSMTPGEPILAVDLRAAVDRLAELPWVKTARIERRLPGAIVVTLEERTAYAVWQHQDEHQLIDAGGYPLSGAPERFQHLPLIVGPDAPAQARTLLPLLAAHPVVNEATFAAIRVGSRRWNLRLSNGIDVQLPEDDPDGTVEQALVELSTLIARDQLLDREIVTVDLRQPDAVLVRISQVADRRMRMPVPRPAEGE
jgi:cell division protein FtsQ